MVKIAWCALAVFTAPAFTQPAIQVNDRRQLLLDDKFVQQAQGIEFTVHPPRKTGDVSIPNEEGWALGSQHSVLLDGGLYRMWYTAHNAICYAQSKDGIHWERPRMNLAKIAGRPENNVVIGYGAGEVKGETQGLMVFIDPNAPPAERYRLVAHPHEFNRFMQLFSSPDGIHWKHTRRDILVFDENKKPHHLDSLNVVFWDDRVGKYVAYVRRSSVEQGRMVARAESADVGHFGDIEQTRIVFNADALNPPGKQKTARIDVYTNDAIKYPWADDVYLLFPSLYYHYGSYLREFRAEAPTNAGVLDARFASSRDGIQWNTYDWHPFVSLGMPGEFDSRRIYMGYGMVPSLDGREIYLYYLGTSDTHGWDRDDRNNRLLTAAGVAPQPLQRAISRLVLRRDGFVSVRAGREGGSFTTPPLRFQGEQLVLNVDTSALGEVQVEIQDEQGRPIPGFDLAASDIIHSANEISRVVTWNGQSTLQKIAGRAVRLHFLLRDADVYAFQFRERPSI